MFKDQAPHSHVDHLEEEDNPQDLDVVEKGEVVTTQGMTMMKKMVIPPTCLGLKNRTTRGIIIGGRPLT